MFADILDSVASIYTVTLSRLHRIFRGLWLKAYIDAHPFDSGDSDCETVLDQLYQAYAESHESDPPEIGEGFKELEDFLCTLPLDDNNAVFNLCCRLCSAYEHKAFIDGVQYGAHLMLELR